MMVIQNTKVTHSSQLLWQQVLVCMVHPLTYIVLQYQFIIIILLMLQWMTNDLADHSKWNNIKPKLVDKPRILFWQTPTLCI